MEAIESLFKITTHKNERVGPAPRMVVQSSVGVAVNEMMQIGGNAEDVKQEISAQVGLAVRAVDSFNWPPRGAALDQGRHLTASNSLRSV